MTLFNSEQDARAYFFLFKARRDGDFAEAYADVVSQCQEPGDRDMCVEIGAGLEEALRRRKGSAARVRQLIRPLVRRAKAGDNRPIVHQEIEALDDLATHRARAEREGRSPEARAAYAFGAFIGLAAACETLDIEADTASVATLASRGLSGEGISTTDVLNAVKEFTTYIPLHEWIAAVSEHPIRGTA